MADKFYSWVPNPYQSKSKNTTTTQLWSIGKALNIRKQNIKYVRILGFAQIHKYGSLTFITIEMV